MLDTIDTASALRQAVAEAHDRYRAENPKSAERQQEAAAHMPGGNTRSVLHYAPFPLAFERGEGCHLWSADGHRYTDFLGDYTAGLYGHSHPRIMQTLHEVLAKGISFGGHNLLEGQLAALFCARFPSLDLVRFTNSGTESNLMALATASALTGRRGVLVFEGGYHGGVFSFAGGGSPINAPYHFIVGSYNDQAGTAALIQRHAGEIAAILVEPMLGAGGSIPADAAFLHILQDAAQRIGALFVLDEVMTSRLHPGGLQALHGLKPDLTSFGKYLGGGMSFGAFGGKRAIMEHYDPTRPGALPHAGTFNNNVLSMAAGIVGLSEILTEEALVALNRRGDALRHGLNAEAAQRGLAVQVTGLGSLMTVHFSAQPFSSAPPAAETQQLLKELLFFDLLTERFWFARRAMIALSLPVTDDDCSAFITAFGRFLDRRTRLIEQTA